MVRLRLGEVEHRVRVFLAEASAARVEANRAAGADAEMLQFDSSTFEAWFSAYVAGNEQAMEVAARRFRPEFQVAFDAWQATNPETNPDAPPGPTYMPEYERPGREEAQRLDAEADEHFADGVEAGEVADRYVRITVYLATVLFLVGISGHFRVPDRPLRARRAQRGHPPLRAGPPDHLSVAPVTLPAAPSPWCRRDSCRPTNSRKSASFWSAYATANDVRARAIDAPLPR